MHRYLFLLFHLLQTLFTANAQVSVEGTVIDARTKEKIPYASVSVGTAGSYTDLDGFFRINIKDSLSKDSLYIKCLGYETKGYSLKEITHKQIRLFTLTPLPVQLQEVNISPDRKTLQTGKIKGDADSGHRGPIKGYNLEIARLIHLDTIREKYIKLKKIKYFIVEDIFDDSEPKAPFGVRLYAMDTTTGLPGEHLIPRNIVIQAKRKNRWAEADLDSLNIYLPHSGVFASMQWLPIHPEYWWTNTYTRPGSKKKITDTIYGQTLGLASVGNQPNFYSKHNSRWMALDYPPILRSNTPMIYIEVEVFD